MFVLLKTRKDIFKTIYMLVLANKKNNSKNQNLFNLSLHKNLVIIMLYILKAKLSIFSTLILVN